MSDGAGDAKHQEEDSPGYLLNLLTQTEEESRQQKKGLDKYRGLRVDKPSDFPALDPKTYASLKEELPLSQDLPRAPSLGSLAFLIKKGSQDRREQFEDHWASSTLTYAAAAEVYAELTRLLNAGTIPDDDPVFQAGRRLLLAADAR